MSEQALNLRRPAQIVRRHRILVGVVTALGLLMGVAYSVLTPPMLTSTALVVLPRSCTERSVDTGRRLRQHNHHHWSRWLHGGAGRDRDQ